MNILSYRDGDWGWGLGPIPNPQSPIPNPPSPIPNMILPQYDLCLTLILNFFYIN